MDHALIVHVFKPEHHARKHELCFFLREPTTLAYVIAQVTTCEKIGYKVEIFSILKGVINIDEERVLEFLEQFLFAHN